MVERGSIEDAVGLRFEFLEPDETSLARFRPSVRVMFVEVLQQVILLLVGSIIPLALILYAQDIDNRQLEAAARFSLPSYVSIYGLFVLFRLARAGLEIYFTEYVITDKRAYAVTALIGRRVSVIPFEKVTNLRVRRSFFERLIKVEQIHLVAYGLKGTQIAMRGVEKTDEVFRRLQVLVRRQSSAANLLTMD